MELAIIGGLLGLGWSLSAKGTTPRTPQKTPGLLPTETRQFPFDNDVAGQTALDADVRKTRDHVARTVRELNVNYPDVISQRTALFDSGRRMETFIGAEDTWQHKRETARAFDPTETRGVVTSGGTIRPDKRYDPQDLLDRGVFATRMNNVLPFEQKRVGPGLGLGADVPSSDGFHSQFRIMPTDSIDPTRINQLPARAPTGGALAGMSHGDRRYDDFQQNRPSLVEHTPAVSGPRGFSAPTCQPDVLLKPTKAHGTSGYYTGGAFVTDSAGKLAFETQTRKKVLKSSEGPRSSRFAAPTETTTQYTKGTSTRTSATPMITGQGASGRQRYVIPESRDTPRKLAEDNTGGLSAGASSATIRAGPGDSCWILKDTARESMNSCSFTGGGSVIGGGSARVSTMESTGLRESEAVNTGGVSYLKKTAPCLGYRMGPGRETEGRINPGTLPGGVLRDDPGRVQRRVPTNAFDVAPSGFAPHAQQTTLPGTSTPHRKLPGETRRDLGLGVDFACAPAGVGVIR